MAKAEHIKYPKIEPVSENGSRPFFSVMIPTYNRVHYLEQTLKSVLEQDLGLNVMQIGIVDDCSIEKVKMDIRAVIRSVGGNRVSFYSQPQTAGISNNWNTCINKAIGYWVHILHDDDMVLPGFYSRLWVNLKEQVNVGAAFCRHIFMDEDGHWQSLSPLERKTPGILTDWLKYIAVEQRIQCPAIVVKRGVYEELGGFLPQFIWAVDWEMWKRIAVHYPIWYEPQPLACYRIHSSSYTSHLMKKGTNIKDIRRCIEATRSYLPQSVADKLSNKAKENYAIHAINSARIMLVNRDIEAATAQIYEALKCSFSPRVIRFLISFLTYIITHVIVRIIGRWTKILKNIKRKHYVQLF